MKGFTVLFFKKKSRKLLFGDLGERVPRVPHDIPMRDNSEIMKVSMNQLSALLKSVSMYYVLSHFGPTESLIQIHT